LQDRKTVNIKHKKFFTQALIADTFRGRDSTGIFAVPFKLTEEVDIFKKALTGYDFIESNQFSRFSTDFNDYKFIVGHNRASTRGASNAANAHPFQHGGITMVHNGTLNAHNLLIKGKETFIVDSEALCFAFDERSAEEVIPEINGAFALIWHDAKDDSINFVRNSERPFAIAKIKGEEAIIGASEVKMLEWLADRNEVEIEEPVELKEGILMSFTDTFTKPNKLTKLKLKPKHTPSRYTSYYSEDDHGWSQYKTRQSTLTQKRNDFGSMLNIKEKDVIDFTLDRVERHVANKQQCNIYGTYRSTQGVTYPVRQHSVPYHSVKDWKKGDALAGFITTFVSNRDQTHIPKSSHYIAVASTDKTDSFVKLLMNRAEETSKTIEVDKKPTVIASTLVGPNGINLNYAAFKSVVEDGCVVCTGNVHPVDHKKTLWTSDKRPICKECSTTNVGREHADTHYAIL
jgi:hypothetical protein